MNWEAVSAIAESVGALGVIITLVYLAVQIRQNTRAQKGIVVDSLASSIADINIPASQDPKVGIAIAETMRDWDAASPEQRAQAHFFHFSIYKLIENAFYQHAQGVLSSEEWEGWDNMARSNFHAPGLRDSWWDKRKMAFSAAFQDYMDNSAKPRGITPLSEIISGTGTENEEN